MDAVSFGVSAFSAARELYKLSMATYAVFTDIKTFPESFKKLALAFRIERRKLKEWAECMGLDQDSGFTMRIREDLELLGLINEILRDMSNALQDSAKMIDDYSRIHGEPLPEAVHEKLGFQQRISSSTGAKKFARVYSKMVKWGILDKKRLEDLIQELISYNEKLHRLATPAEQASLRRLLRMSVVVSTKPKDLPTVQEAAALVGRKDLEKEMSSRAFVKKVYAQEEPGARLRKMELPTSLPLNSELPESMGSWKFDIKNFHFYQRFALTVNHTCALANYHYPNGEKIPILVNWSRREHEVWRGINREAAEIRLTNLARVLNRDILPHGFHVLKCLGYVFASSTTIGIVFSPPTHTVMDAAPVSLHDLLTRPRTTADVPPLGIRFELAKAVTTTLYEFHNIGWLHKNIHPANVIFFHFKSTPDAAPTLNLRKPYLVGFDLSRSNQPGEFTEKPIASEGDDLYRHPSYTGRDASDFKPAFDYFSLGIVLYEIALWKSASGGIQKNSGATRCAGSYHDSTKGPVMSEPPQAVKPASIDRGSGEVVDATSSVLNAPGRGEKLLVAARALSVPNDFPKAAQFPPPMDLDAVSRTIRKKAADLGRFVGERYRDAVLTCVSMELDAVWESNETSDVADKQWAQDVLNDDSDEDEDDNIEEKQQRNRQLALQKAVQKRVVDGIELCQA